MLVRDLRRSRDGLMTRVSATVEWEQADRTPEPLHFAVGDGFADDLAPNPNAMLLATIMPAMHHGEDRVRVDGAICPRLRDGLVVALDRLWHATGRSRARPVAIETTEGFAPPTPRHPERTASFMSGGVDALAALRRNRLSYPPDHPGAIADCMLVHGFDFGGPGDPDLGRDRFERDRVALEKLTRSADANLLCVETNLRRLEAPGLCFPIESCGAALGAVAHACSGRLTEAVAGSSAAIRDGGPAAQHPLIDPSFTSSSAVTLRQDGAWSGRLDKIRLLSDWPEALDVLHCCNDPQIASGAVNCGACEKCLLTMTELLVCGSLDRCSTFEADDVSADQIVRLSGTPPAELPAEHLEALRAEMFHIDASGYDAWHDLIEPLERTGRRDLASAVSSLLRECDRHHAWVEQRDWKGRIRRLDARWLNGTLTRLAGVGR
ncbi:MAG: hypothetical protein CMJ18_27925 [Phycisphaeraceae bacterium]|nr:hypothetical protein [Phycisphaeraceae bacterium]